MTDRSFEHDEQLVDWGQRGAALRVLSRGVTRPSRGAAIRHGFVLFTLPVSRDGTSVDVCLGGSTSTVRDDWQ